MVAKELGTVVWDIDGVQAQTTPTILTSANQYFGLRLTWQDFNEDFVAMTGQDPSDVREWWLEFCRTEFSQLSPVDGMPRVALELGAYCEQVQLTSRRSGLRSVTEAWTYRHYGDLFLGKLNMMGIDWDKDKDAHRITKASRFSRIPNSLCLIDDEIKHALGVARLMGKWGIYYNQFDKPIPSDVPPTFLVANSPSEVLELVVGKVLGKRCL